VIIMGKRKKVSLPTPVGSLPGGWYWRRPLGGRRGRQKKWKRGKARKEEGKDAGPSPERKKKGVR